MKRLTFSLFTLLPLLATAQETQLPPKRGMVMEGGVWTAPTPETAMRDLLAEVESSSYDNGHRAAVAVLQQTFDVRSLSELDAFAAELELMFRNGTDRHSDHAFDVLWLASKEPDTEGTPYRRAVDVFIRVYESFDDRTHPRALTALRGVMYAGGVKYVRNVFNTTPQPPACEVAPQSPKDPQPENPCPNVSPWCDAGELLKDHTDEGPDPAWFWSICDKRVEERDGWISRIVH